MERRVLEELPPSEIAERVAPLRAIAPVRRCQDLGTLVVGSHRAAGEPTHDHQQCPKASRASHRTPPSPTGASRDPPWIGARAPAGAGAHLRFDRKRSEEHTSELQSPDHLVCRLLLEKKKKKHTRQPTRRK